MHAAPFSYYHAADRVAKVLVGEPIAEVSFGFGREDLPCHRYETPIRRGSIGGRNIFFCSSCQSAE
jgi:hypothetical protein